VVHLLLLPAAASEVRAEPQHCQCACLQVQVRHWFQREEQTCAACRSIIVNRLSYRAMSPLWPVAAAARPASIPSSVRCLPCSMCCNTAVTGPRCFVSYSELGHMLLLHCQANAMISYQEAPVSRHKLAISRPPMASASFQRQAAIAHMYASACRGKPDGRTHRRSAA